MRMLRFSAPFLLASALLLAGCATNMVGMEGTAAMTSKAGELGQTDLETGRAQFRSGNFGLAEKHFRKAVAQQSDDPEAWMGLAATYDRLGRFDLADRAYEQLLKKAGRRPEVVNNLGYSHLLRGETKKARQLLAEAKAGMTDKRVAEANLKLLGG